MAAEVVEQTLIAIARAGSHSCSRHYTSINSTDQAGMMISSVVVREGGLIDILDQVET